MSVSICVFVSSLAPDGPPLNIQSELRDPDQVMFSWSPPREELRNGVIQSYLISCIAVGREEEPIISTVTGEVETVSGFTPATRYNCSLAARTSVGYGVNGTLLVLTSKYNTLCTYAYYTCRSDFF